MSEKIRTAVEHMSPEKAAKLLKQNKKNRPLSRAVVRRYAETMKSGGWVLNGENLIVANDGTLIDGQHRLNAIIESDTTVPLMITYGVDKKAYRTIDVGKKRTGADAVATHDERFEKNRMILAASAKIVYAFDNKGMFDNNRSKLENDDLITFVEKHKGLLRSVEFAQTLTMAKKIVPASALAAMHYLFSKKDVNLAERFFSKLNSGENIAKDDPISVLRNRLFILSQEDGVIRAREVIPYLVKAWEYLREGRKIERMVVPKDYVSLIV